MKKYKTVLAFFMCLVALACEAQKTALPASFYPSSDTSRSLIFYITGDGGFNKFSNGFMQSLNKAGYAVIGLDAKDYFWNKKKPEEAAAAFEALINDTNRQWKRKNILLLGYSFGADVAPFMLNRFSSALSARIGHVFLLSPSTKTDFEIHVLQMLGWGRDAGQSVPTEINKTSKPVTIIVGDDENEFPFSQLAIRNRQIVRMPGGHHYDGNIDALTRQILSQAR
jgi:type IV secretory pathway VirJ component